MENLEKNKIIENENEETPLVYHVDLNIPKYKENFDWKSILYSFGVVLGGATQVVSLPLWIRSFNKSDIVIAPYFILLLVTIAFFLIFGFLAFIFRLIWKYDSPSIREYWRIFLLIGFFNSINGFFIVYAGHPSRTSPILQGLFVNTSILWSIPLSKYILKELTFPTFFKWKPILSILLLLLGVFISLLPFFLNGSDKIYDGELPWSFIFLLGIGAGAVYNVLQEKFLKIRAQNLKDKNEMFRNESFDMLCMIFWVNLFQGLFVLFFFWVDILPWFGESKNLSNFGRFL